MLPCSNPADISWLKIGWTSNRTSGAGGTCWLATSSTTGCLVKLNANKSRFARVGFADGGSTATLPVMDLLIVSAAVMIWVPLLFKVTPFIKVWTPLSTEVKG